MEFPFYYSISGNILISESEGCWLKPLLSCRNWVEIGKGDAVFWYQIKPRLFSKNKRLTLTNNQRSTTRLFILLQSVESGHAQMQLILHIFQHWKHFKSTTLSVKCVVFYGMWRITVSYLSHSREIGCRLRFIVGLANTIHSPVSLVLLRLHLLHKHKEYKCWPCRPLNLFHHSRIWADCLPQIHFSICSYVHWLPLCPLIWIFSCLEVVCSKTSMALLKCSGLQ